MYGGCHGISIHSLGSLVVIQIYLESFDRMFEFITFYSLTLLLHGFLYLQPCSLFRTLLWIHTDQGDWIVQIASAWFTDIARTCEIVGQVSTHMIQVVSSADDYSYAIFLFVLIPSLGYQSYISTVHLIVSLSVHADAIIFERELNVTVATRYGYLGNLAKGLVRQSRISDILTELKCGVFNAIAFLLADWLEVNTCEQEYIKVLPNPSEVYMLVDSFKWTFILCSIGFWTVRNTTWVDIDFASDVYLAASSILRPTTLQGIPTSQHITAPYGRFSTNESLDYVRLPSTSFPSGTIDFSKVYFFKYIILIDLILLSFFASYLIVVKKFHL
ncbi:uncharacterized protein LOC113287484 [Papaver somniferum]|uniref:uncharacterized protein LOC113287484 n=1 Tax=Papaver somniferum TaxID=3469 RepID=UPI000E6F746A|nr:uncharacterized protein LOC113287484 [Papaver somniferum]